jgi:hypothetical protein|nr:hypothetical protein [Kofleriaceae bacterium]
MRRRPIAVAAVAAGVAIAIGVVAIAMISRRTPPHHRVAPRVDRPGAPPHDAELAALVVAIEGSLVAERGDLPRDPPPIVARGSAATDAWQRFADTVAAWTRGATDDADATAALEHDLHDDVRDLDRALVAAGADQQLELRFVGRGPDRVAGVIAHQIDDIAVVTIDGAPRRVLGLRRSDGTRDGTGALGIETPELGPVLMLDAIASYAITDVLPALAPAAPFPLARDAHVRTTLGVAVGAAVRAEVLAALGEPDATAAARIATVVADRDRVVHATWRSVRVGEPLGLYLDDAHRARGERESTRGDVDDLEDQLDALDADRVAARLAELVVASVRRHEAEHVVDLERAAPLPYPPALEAIAGPATDDTGAPNPSATFARAELAAYLAQLIADPVTPQLTLWGVVALSYDAPGTAAGRAGRVIVDGLARQLGAREPSTVEAVTTCTRATGGQLRDAARALWRELYGEPPLAITP